MKITYSSNNSGGGWWLKDKDWIALEKAGWHVFWGGLYFCHSRFSFQEKPVGKPEPHASSSKCPGHRRYDTFEELGKDRYMGALAKEACKNFKTPGDAMQEFEEITKQDVSEEGCNCCGAPHSFNWGAPGKNYGYASGEDCLAYLFPDKTTNLSKRELLERT